MEKNPNINRIIEDAQLMKQNRADLVKALNDIGFTQVNETTPLSEIAEYMKWAGGLRDIRLACINKSTKQQEFFTREQWEVLSASAKASYIRIGVCIRAERQEFIIAKDNATTESGSITMMWCQDYTDVKNLTNYYGLPSVFDDYKAKENTDLILAMAESTGKSFPAAERARAYKAATYADGGAEDPTEWSLPAAGHMILMYKYFLQINAELTYYFGSGSVILDDWYWTSTECYSSYAWLVYMDGGLLGNGNKTGANRVRPVAPVAVPSVSPAMETL